MASSLQEAVRLIKKGLLNALPDRSAGETKRDYTKRVITETTEEAYEVVCGVAGCVLRKKE
ncbi:hypothetical protein [Synechococcus sp. UW140]|uniref:hypothetical protein n=1 Tax=Synechococcus sp. UW140 TaxID=368503 RepID=UPI000E0E314A|nr:hypothetical protein [Synechococcus sp. UW140]